MVLTLLFEITPPLLMMNDHPNSSSIRLSGSIIFLSTLPPFLLLFPRGTDCILSQQSPIQGNGIADPLPYSLLTPILRVPFIQ